MLLHFEAVLFVTALFSSNQTQGESRGGAEPRCLWASLAHIYLQEGPLGVSDYPLNAKNTAQNPLR